MPSRSSAIGTPMEDHHASVHQRCGPTEDRPKVWPPHRFSECDDRFRARGHPSANGRRRPKFTGRTDRRPGRS